MNEDEGNWWMLCREDAKALEDIRDELWCWIETYTFDTSSDLLALAAVIMAIESVLNREEFDCNIQIDLTYRVDEMDGLSANLSISYDCITLYQTEYISTGQGTSCDHGCDTFAHLGKDGGFPTHQIEEWFELVQRIKDGSPKFNSYINSLNIEG